MNIFYMNSLFARGVGKLVQMLYAGFLWFLFSLPVVTIGAASTALYEVMMKAAKEEEGYIGKSFLNAFRNNFKKSTYVWLPILAAGIIFVVNLFYYAVLGGGNYPVQSVVFFLLLLAGLAVYSYAFPILARFENTTGDTFRMAFILLLQNPGWTVVLIILQIVTLFLVWFLVYIPLLFLMGITGYIQAVIFNHIFDRLIDQGKIIPSKPEKSE